MVVGGALLVTGGFGFWLAALPSVAADAKAVAFTFFFGAVAVVHGGVILSWRLRSRDRVLMRMQLADILPGILPLVMFASEFLAVPALASPARPYMWMAGLLLASAGITVMAAEKVAPSEIPPLRRGRYRDWLRWQAFGLGTLLLSLVIPAMFFSYPSAPGAAAPLIVGLALAQSAVSIWRIIEQRQVSKAGVRLSGLQISWLRVIHIRRGHEAAVRELRTMYPKIGPLYADAVIENLYRTEEEPRDAA
ncbi:hypothetical protein [Arthrobacter sp. NPDC057013]|uniref:hypothetical protein n=1 Tax=Arthrobacter sp. NPDC057013 TaxID=3345999 RepID=UPI003631F9C6